MNWWNIALLVILVLALQAAIGILMERRNPTATLAWLMILVLVPVVGLPFYLLFGRTIVRRNIRKSAAAIERFAHSTREAGFPVAVTCDSSELGVHDAPIADLIRGLDGFELRPGNRVDVLQDGPDTFDSMIEAIDTAERYVHFEYFIFEAGVVAERFRDALCRAAERGVQVRMMADAFGSIRTSWAWVQPLLDAGAEVDFFSPVRLRRWRRRPDFRNHRKIKVIDGRVGFVGGINICDDYLETAAPDTPWRDTHLRVEGPVVHDLERCLMDMWHLSTGKMLATPEQFPEPVTDGSSCAQLIAGGPDDAWVNHIEKTYLTALHTARESISIATPYFIPSEAMLQAIVMSSLRGVRVRMLVPAEGDSRIVQWAARSYYPELLEAGIEVFEFGPRMMHAKVLSVDGRFAAVGTPNLDIRSLRLNYEVSVFVFDKDVTAALDRALDADFAVSQPVTCPERTGLVARVTQNTARLLSPLL